MCTSEDSICISFFLNLFSPPVVGREFFLKLHVAVRASLCELLNTPSASPRGLSPLLWAGGGQVRETCAEPPAMAPEGCAAVAVELSPFPALQAGLIVVRVLPAFLRSSSRSAPFPALVDNAGRAPRPGAQNGLFQLFLSLFFRSR